MHPRSTKGPLLITTAAVCRSDRSRLRCSWNVKLLRGCFDTTRSSAWTVLNSGHFVPVCVAGTTSYIFKQMTDDQLPWLSLSTGKQRMLVECRPDFSFWSSLPLLLFKWILSRDIYNAQIVFCKMSACLSKGKVTHNMSCLSLRDVDK